MHCSEETWKTVPGWEQFYQVSDMGRVRSLDRIVPGKGGRPMRKRGIILKQRINCGGYPQVTLVDDGFTKTSPVHSLVLAAFVGPRPDGMQVCHNDGVKTNNKPSNLRYDTASGNYHDRKYHGTENDGRRNGRAKLTENDIRNIRSLRGSVSGLELSRRYGVVNSVIYAIQNHQLWRNVI